MKKYHKVLLITLIAIAAIVMVGFLVGYGRIARHVQSLAQSATIDRSAGEPAFPTLDETSLTQIQKAIIATTKQEFATQPPGTKYSEGTNEAWCSDFVSWVMRQAGAPLVNPNSGSWRIPGTLTLLDYYQSKGMFKSASSGYVPKLGDVAIYQGSPIFGDHTNIVLSGKNGIITTVGGNENGHIRIYQNVKKQYNGLLGYGVDNRISEIQNQ